MLLMEHCNDIDQGNPCARSREGSWHGTSDEAGTTRRSVGWSKQSPVGSRGSRKVKQLPRPALAEAVTSESLSPSPTETSDLCGAVHFAIDLPGALSATFAGAFKAATPGSAQVFLQRLSQQVKNLAILKQTCTVLRTALEKLNVPDLCAGSAAFICNGTLDFLVLGNGLMALSHEDSKRSKTELLAGPEFRQASQNEDGESLDLAKSKQSKRCGFGSIIPVDRSSLSLSQADAGVVFGECQLTASHQFLLLGAGPLDEAITADEAIEFVERVCSFPSQAGKAASLLTAECHKILTARRNQEPQIAVAVLHLSLPSPLLQQSSKSSNASEQTSSPYREQLSSTSPTLLSPSGRRVHFLRPYAVAGEEAREHSGGTAFADAATGSQPFSETKSGSWEAQLGSLADSSGLLSSGSMLSRPDMSIPEDKKLPAQALALQLPPPLLTPIRKAYPSRGELRSELSITPEMLSSPSPVRKAKIGRAASFNSPHGLWPLPPQQYREPIVRQSSAIDFGSCNRGGEEGRVRGGLPRVSSTLSVTDSHLSRSPTASRTDTPGSSRRASADFDRLADREGAKDKSTDEELSPKVDPWEGTADRRGRKGRGQSQALRLLQGSVGDSSTGMVASTSAPATLSSGLMMSLTQPLDRMLSSGTESIVLSVVSGSSSGSRVVKHVPCIEDSPQGLRLASTSKENCYPSGPNPFELHRVPEKFSTAGKGLSTDQVRRTFSDLTGQRYPTFGIPPASREQAGQPIPVQGKSKKAGSSWPEIDSAAATEGLLKSLSSESRQHSGMMFSQGSLNKDLIDSLADSVDSVKLNDSQ